MRIPVFNVLDEDEVVLDGECKEDAAPSSDIAAARRQQRKVETSRLKRLRKRMADLARFTQYKEVVAYRAKNETGWMVSPLMVAWLTDVFVPNTTPGADGLLHLYMDNMGAHETPSVQMQMMESGIRFHPMPPNCSHLLQPLDHSLNATVKYVYRLLHARRLLRPIEQGVSMTRSEPDISTPRLLVIQHSTHRSSALICLHSFGDPLPLPAHPPSSSSCLASPHSLPAFAHSSPSPSPSLSVSAATAAATGPETAAFLPTPTCTVLSYPSRYAIAGGDSHCHQTGPCE